MTRAIGAGLALALLVATGASAASVHVGGGSSLSLGSAQVNIGCGDLRVDGLLDAGVSLMAARDFTVGETGMVLLRNADVEITGDWRTGGSIDPGDSEVRFVDGCDQVVATVFGSSSFSRLSLETQNGKSFYFESGQETTVADSLTIMASGSDAVRVRSTVDGSESGLFLETGAAQSVILADVEDIHSTGESLVAGPDSILGGNTIGWTFLGGSVPAAHVIALAMTAGAILLAASRAGARGSYSSPSSRPDPSASPRTNRLTSR